MLGISLVVKQPSRLKLGEKLIRQGEHSAGEPPRPIDLS